LPRVRAGKYHDGADADRSRTILLLAAALAIDIVYKEKG